MSKLTDKQRRFAIEYAACLNATQAAKAAGYSEKTAYSQGQRLLKKVEIRAAIDRHLEQQAMGANEVLAHLANIARNYTSNDQIRALELLGKAHVLFTDRVRVDDWRSQAIEDIKAGLIDYAALASAFDTTLADELFRQAGVSVDRAT